MPRNPLAAGGVFEPDPTNPLTGSYTAADAADWHRQNVRDAWAAAKDPQTWQDAADQYAQGMLMGSVAPEMKAGQWFHGTSGKFDAFNTPEVYLTDHAGQALKYAENAHRPFTGNAGTPRVLSVTPKPGKVYNIDDHIASGMDDGLDLNDVIADWAANARARGDVRYLEYTHPNAGDQGDHTVRVSLYPQEDLAIGGQPGAAAHPLATNAAPEAKGLGLDAAAMKVLRANSE